MLCSDLMNSRAVTNGGPWTVNPNFPVAPRSAGQFGDIPSVDEDMETTVRRHDPILSPLFGLFPRAPFPDHFNAPLLPYNRVTNSMAQFPAPSMSTALEASRNHAISCQNINGPGNYANHSLHGNPPLSIHHGGEPHPHCSLYQPLLMQPIFPITNLGSPVNLGSRGPVTEVDEPQRPRGKPRGRPRAHSLVQMPVVSLHNTNLRLQCDWEGKCTTCMKADPQSVSRHIKAHIAEELSKAMSSEADGEFTTVRFTFNSNRIGLTPGLTLGDVELGVRVRMIMENGKVWAKCLWGEGGCCHSNGKLTLNYLPRHIWCMHLGMGY